MTMFDQLIIGTKASYDDFGASLAGRSVKMPAKKSIRETVPFSNITYDFSRIDGEQYWEARDLEYTFEITADTPEELEDKKRAFAAWVANVFEEEIHDPYIFGYHFIGTYEDMTPSDEETMDKTTVTVKFKAEPYLKANAMRLYELAVPASGNTVMTVHNGSAHRIVPTLKCDGIISFRFGGDTFTLTGATLTDSDGQAVALALEPGATVLTLENGTVKATTFRLSFTEEVF